MKRTIKNPFWTNNARTILSAEFHYDDGRIVNAVITDGDQNNPDFVEIMNNFSAEDIENNTRANIRKVNDETVRRKQEEEAKAQRLEQEKLFAVKLKIFEVDAIKNSDDRALKSKIRKSKSDVEAMAYASALLYSEFQKEQSPQE
jgi:hypothetical protein